MKNHWTLVDTPSQLKKAEKPMRTAAIIALDTEYDSFRCFRDKLCLIQVQTGEKTWLIDPLAGLDLSFLGEVLDNPAVLKIFHAGDNDIRILKRDYAFAFRNIFDTHRAASLLGCRHLSLATLLESYLDVVLVKKMQRSRWDLRPLSEEQLDYAALDTAHLIALYQRLDGELREKRLEKQAQQVFTGMTEVLWQAKILDGLAHRRLPGYGALTSEQKDHLRRLFRWRFEKAQETNCALFMLLTDRQLIDLSRLENPSLESLTGPGLLSPEKAHRFGPELLAILQSEHQL
ncbi:MAG: ribonuclease D [Syntrophales bacterium]|nr:ribonuclease D [Syntrophales bacterium]